MIRRAAAIVLALALGPPPGRAGAQEVERQVFTRAELEAAGVHRFSELLEWIGGWGATVNGLAWSLAPDALPGAALPRAGLPEWTLVVDGQRVEIAGLGAWFPEIAPTALLQVDSVEVVRAPRLAGGAFASRGTVRVHSRSTAQGVSLQGWFRTGSEIGDAGPYIHTPLSTPNVDRTGHDHTVVLGYGGRGWDVQFSRRRLTHPATDPPLVERYGTRGIKHFVLIRGPSLRLGANAFGGRHELLLGEVDQKGFVYLPARGRMERSDITSTHAGATGSFAWGAGTALAYRASRASLELLKSHDRSPAGRRDLRTLSHGSLELRHRFPRWQTRAGVGVDDRRLEMEEGAGEADPPGEQGAESESRLQATLYAEVEREPSAALRPRLSAALARVGSELGAKAAAGARWQIDSTRALAGSLSIVQHLPSEGVAWMDARSLRDPLAVPPPRRTLLWSELGWEQRVGPSLTVEAGGVYGGIAEAADGELAPKGGRFGVRVGALLRGSSRFAGRLTYQSIAPLAANPALQRAMQTIAEHSVTGYLAYTPVPSLRLGARVHLRSATDWGGVSPSLVDAEEELDAISRLDVSVEKWMWRRRLRTQLQVRNVLNTTERYHPYGTDFDLRYFVGLHLALPALP